MASDPDEGHHDFAGWTQIIPFSNQFAACSCRPKPALQGFQDSTVTAVTMGNNTASWWIHGYYVNKGQQRSNMMKPCQLQRIFWDRNTYHIWYHHNNIWYHTWYRPQWHRFYGWFYANRNHLRLVKSYLQSHICVIVTMISHNDRPGPSLLYHTYHIVYYAVIWNCKLWYCASGIIVWTVSH